MIIGPEPGALAGSCREGSWRCLQGRGAFQDASQATLDDTAVMAPLTRLSKTVADARNLNHWFRHALTTMWAQPRGPVHLSFAHDALTQECAADYVKVLGFFPFPVSGRTSLYSTLVHGHDERIAVDDLSFATRFLYEVAVRFCAA